MNAIAFAVMTIFASGISMNALAKLLNQLAGLELSTSPCSICSGVVLVYVLKGGLTSAIYTEVLQFFMIVLGFAPVVYLGLKDVGGWHAMNHSLAGRRAESRRRWISRTPASLTRRTPGRARGSRCWPARRTIRWAWTGLR